MNSLGSGYRLFCKPWFKHWFSPRTYYYWMKYKIQRANRGWANCDTWSLDIYLAEWLPAALKHLKEHKHGIPCEMFSTEDLEYVHEDGGRYPSDMASKAAEEKWNTILDKMIEGFEAYNRVTDSLYEKELGPYPSDPDWLDNINKPWTEQQRIRFDKSRELEKRNMVKFKEGAHLFIEHFQSLWD